jgi:integrase
MSRTYRSRRGGSGSFRFDGSEIGVRDQNSQRAIRREARRLAAPPDRPRRHGKIVGKAKTLKGDQLERVIAYLKETSRVPESDVLKVYLSHFAGLRACEIAGLTWKDVCDVTGNEPGKYVVVPASIAKGDKGRSVPMHFKVAEALREFRAAYPDSEKLAISSRRGRTQNPGAVAAWFWHKYRRVGYQGCSSHSGRRFYITLLAREIAKAGGSLEDVRIFVGHARIDSTQAYVDPITDAMYAIAASLGDQSELPTSIEGMKLRLKADEYNRKLKEERAAPKRRAA